MGANPRAADRLDIVDRRGEADRLDDRRRASLESVRRLVVGDGVAVRAGTHCAMPLLQRFGVTSTCRASFALYNTRAEVDALADALARAQKLFA